MTEEQLARFRAFEEAEAKKAAEQKKKEDRMAYDELVDQAIE